MLATALSASLLIPLACATAGTANAATTPMLGTPLTIKADPATFAPGNEILSAGTHGVLYEVAGWLNNPATLAYRAYDSATSVNLGTVATGMSEDDLRPALAGDTLTIPIYDEFQTLTGVKVYSTASGTPVLANANVDFTALTDAGYTVRAQGSTGLVLVRATDDGDQILYTAPIVNGVVGDPVQVGTAGQSITRILADDGGILVQYTTDDLHTVNGNAAHLAYAPTGKPLTVILNTTSEDRISALALNNEAVVYGYAGASTTGDRVAVYFRDGRTPVSINLNREIAGLRFAVSGGRLLTGEQDENSTEGIGVLKAQAASSGAAVTTLLARTSGRIVTGPGGNAYVYSIPVVKGQVPAPYLAKIGTGAAATFGNVLPYEPANIADMALSANRLVTADAISDPATYTDRSLNLTSTTVGVTATTRPYTDAETGVCETCTPNRVLVSGARMVRMVVDPDSGDYFLVATNGTSVTSKVPATFWDSLVSLSGKYLVYRKWNSETDKTSLVLLDISTGTAKVLNSSTAAVTGSTLFEAPFGNTGTLVTTDLATGAKGTRVFDPSCDLDVASAVTHWVLYSCGPQQRVFDLDTGQSVTLPADVEARLGDGFVGLGQDEVVNKHTLTLSVMDLVSADHPVVKVATTLGSLEETRAPMWAVDNAGGHSIAYENTTHGVTIVPVNVPNTGAAILEQTIPASFAAIAGKSWAPVVKTTSPVTWTLTVRDPASTTVLYTASSAVASTTVAPTWNGKVGGTGAIVNKAVDYTLTMTPTEGKAITLAGKVTVLGAYATVTAAAPASFTPDGDAKSDVWAPVFTGSTAATWVLTVKNAKAATVYSATSAANAKFAPLWNGKTGTTLNADGNYTWTLTAKPTDGFSPAISKTGTVALRARAVTTTVKAAAYSSDATNDEKVTVSWSTPATPGIASWNVTYREVSTSSTGARVYSASKAWLTGTKSTSAVFTGTRGKSYQFMVTPVDTIRPKNVAGSVITNITKDDRDLTYSTGWTNQSVSGRYKSTLKSSATKGKTATVTFYGTGFKVLGDKGKTKGKFYISVDGGTSVLVDTYATTTKAKQNLFTKALKGGKHTVKITVAGTSGRPTVTLDGIGLTH